MNTTNDKLASTNTPESAERLCTPESCVYFENGQCTSGYSRYYSEEGNFIYTWDCNPSAFE